MDSGHTVETLKAFEDEIAELFNKGMIRAPIHLDGGNEDFLIESFKSIKPNDYVCCSWRAHYKALLHGVPADEVRAEIMAGRSISLCFPRYHFLSSAIVGGTLPIALGVALALKRRGESGKVHCFVGDMTSRGGAFHECAQYAEAWHLPLHFIIEDNGLSVGTPTKDVWNNTELTMSEYGRNISYFKYQLTWPHSGTGKFVEWK